jgi:hypothetical protein
MKTPIQLLKQNNYPTPCNQLSGSGSYFNVSQALNGFVFNANGQTLVFKNMNELLEAIKEFFMKEEK